MLSVFVGASGTFYFYISASVFFLLYKLFINARHHTDTGYNWSTNSIGMRDNYGVNDSLEVHDFVPW